MKRNLAKLLIIPILAVNMLIAGTAVANSSNDYTIFMNQEIRWRNGDVRLIDGVYYIPLRSFFETLGAKVGWDSNARKAIILWDNISSEVFPGQRYITYNRRFIMTNNRAIIINGFTYIPIDMAREVANAYIFLSDNSRMVWLIPRSNMARPHTTLRGKVTEVISGDTLRITYNGVLETVKLIGVNAPLPSHLPGRGPEMPFSNQALVYTRARLQGQEVTIVFDIRDKNNKNEHLAYVYLGNRLFNAELLEMGMGFLALSPPNLRFRDELFRAELVARNTKRGIWRVLRTDEIIIPPWAQFAGTINSTNFHLPNCRHIIDSDRSQLLWFEDLQHAMGFGLRPCPICFR